jgi:kynureninase
LNKSNFENTLDFAQTLDLKDPLKKFREEFHFPLGKEGRGPLYFAGHSLGLQPKNVKALILEELDAWAKFGVEGHMHGKYPWLPYHELLTPSLAKLVGAKKHEVVMMNTLTVNLHLMMVSFYRPTPLRNKILIEGGAFPSDYYAIESQIKFHGFDPKTSIIEIVPRTGEKHLRLEYILNRIEREGEKLALVLLGNANYLTGQAFDMKAITASAHKVGAFAGFDLAHGAGNLLLNLHADGPDFAVWCSYKYLNCGPGGLSGCFVHERHSQNFSGPRFQGWWGQNKSTRFKMEKAFDPILGAEGWQLSNPPIFQLAAARASLSLFEQAGMDRLTEKGRALTSYLEFILQSTKRFEIITPSNLNERGSLLCVRFKGSGKDLALKLADAGVYCDFREPDILRFTPIPIYNNFQDVFELGAVMQELLKNA